MRYLRLLLLPLCPIWAFITQLRTELYLGGNIRRYLPPVPTFTVGNLSTGGTGKSPHTIYIARYLSEKYRTAILSRGYGRKSKGFRMVECDSIVSESGDEALMMKRALPDVTTAVCEKRAEGIKRLTEGTETPQVIVMDDAYQHLAVKASCYMLLTRFDRPFFADYILPAGDLRELRLNASRADMVIVTKTPSRYMDQSPSAVQMREKYCRYISRYTKAPVLFSRFRYDDCVRGYDGGKISLDELKDYNILLVTGIAHPKPLLSFLSKRGIKYQHLSYSDHHTFSDDDLAKIKNDFLNLPSGKNIVLTTEKDIVRFPHQVASDIRLHSLAISVEMSEADTETLHQTLERYM